MSRVGGFNATFLTLFPKCNLVLCMQVCLRVQYDYSIMKNYRNEIRTIVLVSRFSGREDAALQFDRKERNQRHQCWPRRAAPYVRARPRAPLRELHSLAAQTARARGLLCLSFFF